MKRRSTLFLLLVAIVSLFATEASTQPPPPSDITIRSVTPGPGQINVQGDFILGPGVMVQGISVEARPAGDLPGQGDNATGQIMGQTFTATATVPPGLYSVQAVLTVVDGAGNTYSFFSDTANASANARRR